MKFDAILPEIILTLGAIALMMVAAFGGRRSVGATSWGAVALLVAAAVSLFGSPMTAGPQFGGLIVADGFGVFGKMLVYGAAATAIIAAHGWFERGFEHGAEYPVLVLFAVVGMSVMVSATSLMTPLRRPRVEQPQRLRAGVVSPNGRSLGRGRAEILPARSARQRHPALRHLLALRLYRFDKFRRNCRRLLPATACRRSACCSASSSSLAGMAFKVSAVPFHMWTPDVYEGAPTPVTAFFASAPKVAAVLLATRLCLDALGPAIDAWRQIMIVAALASIAVGAIAAYGQTNIKRLLAYSSINNVGFALIGLVAGGQRGASAVLFYMAIYVVMTLGAFLCVLRMKNEAGESVESIDSLSGLSQTRPGLALALAMFMFSLAGIPPLFGFWPKLLVFWAAVDEGLIALAVAGIVGTVIGAYYYLKIIKVMYFDAPGAPYGKTNAPVETALIAMAAIIVSPLGYLLMGPVGRLADNAAASLF